jgi:hypothetical protein
MSKVNIAETLIKELIESHNWHQTMLNALVSRAEWLPKDDLIMHINILKDQSNVLSAKINSTLEKAKNDRQECSN